MDATSKRYACYLVTVMVLTLWFALSPSRETTVFVADKSFRTDSAGETRSKYVLKLALEEGKTYRIEETTTHTATTRNAKSLGKNTFEVLAQTEYRTTVSIDIYVQSVSANRIVCKATLVDFLGYEELDSRNQALDHAKDDDNAEKDGGEDADRINHNKEMFQKIREETRNTPFSLVLGPKGTVEEMDTFKLREKIIAALHDIGQLPMHLEHAVLVADYDVYPANGASFGPQGRTNVQGPVYRMVDNGCNDKHPAFKNNLVKGRILIVNRGGCTFNKKALLAAQFDAIALIVVDTESTELDSVLTYMSGEAEVDIVSVIVNKEAGEAIEDEIKIKADFKTLDNGDMTASDRYLVKILGGVEAVQALNEDDFEALDENGNVIPKRKSHNYNPIHSDGLHDFVGIGYVVDEVIRTRFSIFPDGPVAIGSSWERTMEMSDGIDPTVRAQVKERYKLLSVSRAEGRLGPMVNKGDLIAEIQFTAHEKPAPKSSDTEVERLPINPEPGEQVDASKKVSPQFARPAFRGHEFSTKGLFKVHMKTGHVINGQSTSDATSEKTVVVINKKTKKRKTLKANVDIVAVTDYTGSFL